VSDVGTLHPAASVTATSYPEEHVEAWQIFIFVFATIVPVVLLGARERWADDRLTFRGRPTERDWQRQVDPTIASDEH
jgi:hypothetical protein